MPSRFLPSGAWLRRRRVVLLALVGGGLLAGLGLVAALVLLPLQPVVRREVAHALSVHLHMDASLDELHVTLVPPRLHGAGLRLRLPGRTDVPPFVVVDQFWVSLNPLEVLRARLTVVHVTGLHLVVPPGADTHALASGTRSSRVLIAHLEAVGSDLSILRQHAGADPLVFPIQELAIDDLGYDRVMRFHARLTNPIPRGAIDASGALGPWQPDNPTALPVQGAYEYAHVNLASLVGIDGTLHSVGHFDGRLGAIHVQGHADIPDFSVDTGTRPVPLSANFEALVDATDGTTTLTDVRAILFSTPIQVTGAIVNLPGPGRHDLTLKAAIDQGRVEDVLRLVLPPTGPLLTGTMSMHATVALPPGPGAAVDRLRVAGRFDLTGAAFGSAKIQRKVDDLSARSRGGDNENAARVITNLAGQFRLSSGVLSLPHLTFDVPGAEVALGGTYTLDGERLNFLGVLQMRATVSQAVGGRKSVLLKPFNFLFRKNGAGAIIPIAIRGTPEAPKVGLRITKVLSGGPKTP